MIRRRRSFRHAVIVAATVLMVASCAAPAAPPPTATPTAVSRTGLTYPRTATYFLDQNQLPPADVLARYDVVVIDNEWANRMPRSFFDELRARNPRLKLLAYVDVFDSPKQLGPYDWWRNHYKLWQMDPSTGTTSTLPEQWLARTAAGVPVHTWEDQVMANVTDRSPRVNGQLFVEYAVDWIVNDVWSAGIWDGVFLDVWGDRLWRADSDHWDVDGNGTDESAQEISGPGGALDRGLTIGETRLRNALPQNAILIANGDRVLSGQRLDGKVFEDFMDPAAGRDPVFDIESYRESAANEGRRQPGLMMTINPDRAQIGSPEQFRKGRFELVGTLLQDGFWAPMASSDYVAVEYYDEMDGGGLGRGYLGYPLDATGSPQPGVFRRDFEHGIVLINTAAEQKTIPLEHTYTKLKGTQDPATNDGAQVDSVMLAPQDAIVLVR